MTLPDEANVEDRTTGQATASNPTHDPHSEAELQVDELSSSVEAAPEFSSSEEENEV